MLNAYQYKYHKLIDLPIQEQDLRMAHWIDLVNPTDEERQIVADCYRLPLPGTEEVEEIEATSRFYEDDNGLHIRSLFFHEVDGQPRNTSVAFSLTDERLFTLREREIPAFRLLRRRARREPELARVGISILLTLFEIKIDDLADRLEEVHMGLEQISRRVLAKEGHTVIENAVDELSHQEDINGKVRLCLMDTQRTLVFLQRRGQLLPEHAVQVNELIKDIDSLLPHNVFVFDKINFLMDAALGLISIEQNKIIKIFSIAAVVFLPPTLIASIYGMNFKFLPELDWHIGYPLALGLMVLSGIAPYWYFKRKAWL